MQLDLFADLLPQNKLKDVCICLNGTFEMETKEMNRKLKEAGVASIERVAQREYKQGESIPPAKEKTTLYVLGQNPNPESIKRYELNKHDGYCALCINEQQLMELLAGTSTLEVPSVMKKQVSIDYSYYHWTAPIINGKKFVRKSSPRKYDMQGARSTIYVREFFVPDFPNTNMEAFRQLMGNYGGYANREYSESADAVMLSDDTLQKLQQGIKDEVIQLIEQRYNKSDSKMFNIQFTSQGDFLQWVRFRLTVFPDPSSQHLMDILTGNPSPAGEG